MHPMHPLKDPEKILIAGHRGWKARFPENTLLSFGMACQLGVDMLEMDLNLTRDGELIVVHDPTADRTTDGRGPFREMTLEQVKRLDAGVRFGPEFRGLRVPTFREFLEHVLRPRPDMLFNVEIKDCTREAADKTCRQIAEYGIGGASVVTCFDAVTLGYVRDEHGLRCQGFEKEVMRNFQPDSYKKLYAAGIAMHRCTPEVFREMRALGIDPWPYCPDDEASCLLAASFHPSVITSNDPIWPMQVYGRL